MTTAVSHLESAGKATYSDHALALFGAGTVVFVSFAHKHSKTAGIANDRLKHRGQVACLASPEERCQRCILEAAVCGTHGPADIFWLQDDPREQH